MNILLIIFILIFVSIVLAVRDAKEELAIPNSIKNIKIKQKKGISGTIVFLKEKISHYSSDSS